MKVRELLEERLEDIEKLLADLDGLLEYGLCFDYVPKGTFAGQEEGYFRWQLSWGGPAEEFRFYVDPRLEVERIVFVYLDWDEKEEIELEGKEYELLHDVWEIFREFAPGVLQEVEE